MTVWPTRSSTPDRVLGLLTRPRPGEGVSVALFFSYALLLMLAYYILKTIREPLLLTGSSAELKSYAYAAIAAVLLLIMPLYGALFSRSDSTQLTRRVTLFFILCLFGFYLAGRAGADIGFAYYVWVGVFSVLIMAQFWAFAADCFNVRSGQRLFPVIMLGATLGGMIAPAISGYLFSTVGAWPLMLIAMVLLGMTLPLVRLARDTVPVGSQATTHEEQPRSDMWGGLTLVFRDRYLLLLAGLMVLLNWVNTSGEYILAEIVVRHARELAAADPDLAQSAVIAAFYGNFFSTVNVITALLQLFAVGRIIHWIGVGRAIMVLPVIAAIGYGMVVFLPVFALIRWFKIVENSTDYSLMNTARHALYLPLNAREKYQGKTTIEGFFWRFGDLAQAGAVYIGLHWFNFGISQFAMVNLLLSLCWLGVAMAVRRHYNGHELAFNRNRPPEYTHTMEPQFVGPGQHFEFVLPDDTFTDPDEGDALTLKASEEGRDALPGWLQFDPVARRFSGVTPSQLPTMTVVSVRASDFDGAWVEGQLTLWHH